MTNARDVAMNLLREPWNMVFFVGFVIYVAIRGRFASQTKVNVKTVRRVDALEKTLMVIVISGGTLPVLVYLFTPLLKFADYSLPSLAPWCGLGVIVVAIWLFYRSHADLGLNWSPTLEMREGHNLVTQGVYRQVRHPMYSSIFLFGFAQGLMLGNWLAGWCGFVPFAVMYLLRVRREEAMMLEAFGDEYRDYMTRTGRLFPRFGSRAE